MISLLNSQFLIAIFNSNFHHVNKQMKPFHFLSSSSIPRLLFVTTIALLYGFSSKSTGGDSIGQCGGGFGESVTREFFPMEGDVAWVVQITDLHLSAHHPEIGEDLRSTLSSALRVIRPSLVFITGDITDAKNKKRTSSRQDEAEWIQYRNIMDVVIKESGIKKKRFVDIRGNHDKYGVPFVGDKLDFFSTHSISSQLHRLSTIRSISLVGNDRRYIFLGIDDTMNVGIRGPSHLFGHSTDERIEAVNTELQYWDNDTKLLVTKIVFGHYPLSFIASSESGKHYDTAFAKQSVSAYLCGHLHANFSWKLWRKHTVNLASNLEQSENAKQFWEWELGDWKETRILRILAVDGGKVSFLDIDFRRKSKQQEDFETAILITHPLDSRNMNCIKSKNQISRNDITVLVFSPKPVLNVTAKVYDSSNAYTLIEEIPLKLSNRSANYGILFTSKWNVESYISVDPTHYWMQVFVLDSYGKEIASMARPFSIEGDLAQITIPWMVYLLLHIQWEKLYLILLWNNMTFLVVLLILPKLINHFVEKGALYQRWTASVSNPFFNQLRRVLFWIIWFVVEGSRNRTLWYSMAAYLLYLVRFPWFMGHATSENGELATLFMFGWTMNSYKCSIKKDMLGFPDVMAVTIPFMYLVVSPLFLLIYSLVAERSSFCLYSSGKKSISVKEHLSTKNESVGSNQHVDGVLSKSNIGREFPSPMIHRGWIRKTIFSGCVIVFFIHVKQSSALMGAYGIGPVALSPAFCWVPPILMAAAIYSTG